MCDRPMIDIGGYLKCYANNRLLSVFAGAVQKHGLPECVRTDLGCENVDLWQYMAEQHVSTSAIVTDSSTHNEHIERLWWDVFGVLYHFFFYNNF